MSLMDHIDHTEHVEHDQDFEHIHNPIDEPIEKLSEALLETPAIEAQAATEQNKQDIHKHRLLIARNICVGVAALLFMMSLLPSTILPHDFVYPLRGVAYLFGASAYVSELMVLSNLFRHKQPLRHMFMPYVFGLMYLLLGISYLRH